jgi:hypothetical protein
MKIHSLVACSKAELSLRRVIGKLPTPIRLRSNDVLQGARRVCRFSLFVLASKVG